MTPLFALLIAIIIFAIGIIFGYIARRVLSEGKLKNAEMLSKDIIEKAEKEAITKQKEAIIEAKEQIQKMREKMYGEIEKEQRERKIEWQQLNLTQQELLLINNMVTLLIALLRK